MENTVVENLMHVNQKDHAVDTNKNISESSNFLFKFL